MHHVERYIRGFNLAFIPIPSQVVLAKLQQASIDKAAQELQCEERIASSLPVHNRSKGLAEPREHTSGIRNNAVQCVFTDSVEMYRCALDIHRIKLVDKVSDRMDIVYFGIAIATREEETATTRIPSCI
jgi:hypothetical protein